MQTLFASHFSVGFVISLVPYFPSAFRHNAYFEYACALLGMAVALMIAGGGRASLDARLQ